MWWIGWSHFIDNVVDGMEPFFRQCGGLDERFNFPVFLLAVLFLLCEFEQLTFPLFPFLLRLVDFTEIVFCCMCMYPPFKPPFN